MLDMLIQGGRVVTPAGVGNWDVGIVGEQIVAVAFPGILPTTAKHVIDAHGKIVVPGGKITVSVGPLKPGTYKYFNEYHPEATGTITAVQGLAEK